MIFCVLKPGSLTGCRMASRGLAFHLIQQRFISTSLAAQFSNAEIAQRRNELFIKEKGHQLSLYPRIEKIEVKHIGKSDPGAVFLMNKGLSTPYNCAMHLSEGYCKHAVLAAVDGEAWDMYQPLTKSCEIQFLTIKDEDPEEVNKAYWRSCAMLLGCVLESGFKDEYMVKILRAPELPVISGAFCYDIVLDNWLDNWKPTQGNLHSFTKDVLKLIHKDHPFEPLEVDAKVVLEMFQHNKYKSTLVEEKASQNPKGTINVYRCGDFVDLSDGPHIPRTSFCFQYEVTAAHNISESVPKLVWRFKGLSLPRHLIANHIAWRRLLKRAQKMITEEAIAGTIESKT